MDTPGTERATLHTRGVRVSAVSSELIGTIRIYILADLTTKLLSAVQCTDLLGSTKEPVDEEDKED